MTPKELGELGHLARARPEVDPGDLPPELDDALLEPGQRKSVMHLRSFARNDLGVGEDKPVRIVFDFFAMPVAVEGDGHAERLIVERTALDERGAAHGTGETYAIPASLIVSCIGYRTPPIEGIPYDDRAGRFANDEGRVLPGLYAVGWARRGPTGTIGTNRPDGFAIAEKIGEDVGSGAGKVGRPGLDALLESRGVEVVTFRDWQKIEAAENAAARAGSPREKFVSMEALLAARGA
jgi:ferredoxin--NADP+ reductase